jgi:hypothetical protein
MPTPRPVLKKLDSQLTMYRSSRADSERLGQFFSVIFKKQDGSPDESVPPYIDDLLNGRHPTFQEDDFIIIEDDETGKIVSSMCLISQTWTYGGIPIPAGRPEMVGTDPQYRSRGLVRAMFEEIHERSRQRGELMLGITGIPYYYRIFGYEMCVQLEAGRYGTPDLIPRPSQAQLDACKIRAAEQTDIPFLTDLYQQSCRRLLLACPRPAEVWQTELFARSQKTGDSRVTWIIETPQREPLGFFLHPPFLGPDYNDENLNICTWYALKKGVSYLDVTPLVLEHLLVTGREYAAAENTRFGGVSLGLGNDHPAYQVVEKSLPLTRGEYAWYMRVPDLPAFLMKIAPVLQARLEDSCCSGYTGQINIGSYRHKLSLTFNKGVLEKAEQTPFVGDEDCQANFPAQTFLHLLFGHRTLDELRHILPDVLVNSEVRPLVRALFPPVSSDIWPL